MFVSPAKIIEDLDIGPTMAVADFGCGSGHYSIEAAKKVGKAGKVYAIDIQKEMLSYVRAKAQSEGLTNIETIWTDLELPESSRLRDDVADFVIISNILFQAENKNQIAKEAYRILKSGGRAVVIEWDIENQPALPVSPPASPSLGGNRGEPSGGPNKLGPPMESRISSQAAKDIFEGVGFVFEKEFNPGNHHYGLIFIKSEARSTKHLLNFQFPISNFQ